MHPHERRYYVSWVDPNTDPWPNWQKTLDELLLILKAPVRTLEGGPWKGMPFAEGVMTPAFPGVSFGTGRVCAGPTVTALFHDRSEFADLQGLHKIFLLHPDNNVPERLRSVLDGLREARALRSTAELCLVPVGAGDDVNDHARVLAGLKEWLSTKPFHERTDSTRRFVEVNVNLSPGSEAMHLAWFFLHWQGALADGRTTVRYFRHRARAGDGQSPFVEVFDRDLADWSPERARGSNSP